VNNCAGCGQVASYRFTGPGDVTLAESCEECYDSVEESVRSIQVEQIDDNNRAVMIQMETRISELEGTLFRLSKALEFYANRDNHECMVSEDDSPMGYDKGTIAREVLK